MHIYNYISKREREREGGREEGGERGGGKAERERVCVHFCEGTRMVADNIGVVQLRKSGNFS